MPLQRSLGPIQLLFSVIGGIVGSGWLFGSFYAAQISGPAAIIAWLLGGLMMIAIALTFAEMAIRYPLAGSIVHFAEMAHGPFVGFNIAWLAWLSAVIIAPIEAIAVIQYAAYYFPSLMQKTAGHHNLTLLGSGVAASILLSFCWLNSYGVQWFARTNTAIVVWKLIIPIVAIVMLLITQFHPQNFHLHGGFMPHGLRGLLTALPSAGIIFSFIGFTPALQLAGETRNPQRNILIAICGGIGFCTLLYIALQIALIGALDPSHIQKGWQYLAFSGDSGPLVGLTINVGLIWVSHLLLVDAIVSPYGTGLIYTAATARSSYAGSQHGYFPSYLQTLNRHHIPMQAMLTNFFIGLIFLIPLPGWQSLMTFLVSAFAAMYTIGPLSMLPLRPQEKTQGFHLPCGRLWSWLAFYFCTLILFWTGWTNLKRLLIMVALGYGYFLWLWWRGKVSQNTAWRHSTWLLLYFIGMGILSYCGTFGEGRRWLSFGWDAIALACFSGIIFYLAVLKQSFVPRKKVCDNA